MWLQPVYENITQFSWRQIKTVEKICAVVRLIRIFTKLEQNNICSCWILTSAASLYSLQSFSFPSCQCRSVLAGMQNNIRWHNLWLILVQNSRPKSPNTEQSVYHLSVWHFIHRERTANTSTSDGCQQVTDNMGRTLAYPQVKRSC